VIFDSGLTGSDYISYVATDNYKGGQMAGEYMAKLLNGRGKVAVLRYLEGYDSTTKRENRFIDAVSQHPDIEIISTEQYAGATMETALMASENLFTRFKGSDGKLGFDGIFTPLESASMSIVQAAGDMGLIENLAIVGFDSSDKMMSSLMSGELNGFVVQDPFKIGYIGVKTIVEHLDGNVVKDRVDTGATLITKENLNTPQIQELLKPSIENQ